MTNYEAVRRWREAHREVDRATNTIHKGTKRNPLWIEEWPRILNNYGNKCLKCGSTAHLCVDHVLPVMDNPDERNILANLQPLCRGCNSKKSSDSTDYRPDGGAWILANCKAPHRTLHPLPKSLRKAPPTRHKEWIIRYQKAKRLRTRDD